MNIEWLRIAAEHLEDIYDFLFHDSPQAATNIYNEILDETKRLSDFPQIASIEQSLDAESEMFRSLIIRRQYKVIYFIEDETIKIADVWDCRRDPEKLKKGTTKQR